MDVTQSYDIDQSYQWNYDRGPKFDSPPPDLPEGDRKEFLGFSVRSRLGIAAGLLLNSKWILEYAQRGYDILTYKTVRSGFRPCYDPPNWVFVEADDSIDGPVHALDKFPSDPSRISSAVCFGMPSMAPEVWREDIQRARQGLADGQLLIVSVVATPQEDWTAEQVANDFRQCAEWAAAQAHIVEANFSCPNVCSSEGSIYMDPHFSRIVAETIREGIGDTPLLIKIGHVPDSDLLRQLLHALNDAVDGITLVNGVTRPVLHSNGSPVFGKQYVRAGVLGRAIHTPSVNQVKIAASIIREDKLDLSLAAVGGVSSVADINDFFNAGATAVLMGSSPMYLSDIAAKARQAHPEW